MMESNYIKILEYAFNGTLTFNDFKNQISTLNISDNLKNSMIRLVFIWIKYNENDKFKNDFEIALRDYLILSKNPINIQSYEISNFGKKIGLHSLDESIYVTHEYPSYINQEFALKAATHDSLPKDKLEGSLGTNYFIRKLTGFNKFKSLEQKMCVMGALNTPFGYTNLISMSTGGGKSLITQTISYQYDGLTVIVVPTISLMLDQVINARTILNKGEEAIDCYNSSSNLTKIINKIKSGKMRMLFVSPEALVKNIELKNAILEINEHNKLANFIIDEAHIIFEWGDSFRLDFQCLDVFQHQLLKHNPNLRTFLLSATYDDYDSFNLKKMFSIDNKWIELRCDSLRKEIRYNFIKCDSYTEKQSKLLELIYKLPHPMIVYVNRPFEANELKVKLNEEGILNTEVFTGETSNTEREKILDKWKNDEFQIIIATCAFGVGVDKKDVRTVLHSYIPDNPSKYYQEAGRGGRDGLSSLSLVLYTENDINIAFSNIKGKILTSEKIIGRWKSMYQSINSIKYGDRKIRIDTSIKPSYSDDETVVTIANSRDIDWNVYVLMFFKRNNLITIDNFEYVNKKYYIEVEVLSDELYGSDDILFGFIDKLRKDEWLKSEDHYKKMRYMLLKAEYYCVSETFLETYKMIDTCYCAGCNAHNNIQRDPLISFPLLSSNNYIFNNNSKTVNRLIHSSDFINIENLLSENGYNLFVGEIEEYPYNINQCNLLKLSYKEFYNLIENNTYFLKDKIVFECPTEEYKILKMLKTIDNIKNKFNISFCILIRENYFINIKNKYLYELIEASYMEDYIVKKELINNV